MDFCNILRILRKKKKLTQEELATKLSIAQPIISEWENGEKYPQFENLKKLSSIFDISLDELMGAKENLEIARHYKVEHLSREGVLRLSDLRNEFNLTLEELSKILGITKNTLVNWEKNGLPSFDKYKLIFEHFDLDLDQIMELK